MLNVLGFIWVERTFSSSTSLKLLKRILIVLMTNGGKMEGEGLQTDFALIFIQLC